MACAEITKAIDWNKRPELITTYIRCSRISQNTLGLAARLRRNTAKIPSTTQWLKNMVRARGLESLQCLRDFSRQRTSLAHTERFFTSEYFAHCKLLRLHEVFVSSIVIKKSMVLRRWNA
jgi:hypothetical protein